MSTDLGNRYWWPNLLDLGPLRQHAPQSNPFGREFDYGKAFLSLDLKTVKSDIQKVLTTSQDWWPADYGHYGPFMIRMAWHSAGTYRLLDGRGGAAGGQQRFEPLGSWPDNANLDKARRLLWPIKQKYGRSLSWADLMVLTGNVALEGMGFQTFGFAGGRADDWEADIVYWGPEKSWLASERHEGGKLQSPLGADHMGLIYVNPEGPKGNSDPVSAAQATRVAFGRMAMNDEETAALIAGGHTFGKAHGAHPKNEVGPEPAGAAIEEQGFGWTSRTGKGNAEDTITSGLEGAWSSTPTKWGGEYLDNLLNLEWEKTKSPAGAVLWKPKDSDKRKVVPDAFNGSVKHAPIMFTTDIGLKVDPEYRKIIERFQKDPEYFRLAFAKAWFKLTHRDMGPLSRYLGSEVPSEHFAWQDPLPKRDYELPSREDLSKLKDQILSSGLSSSELVRTAFSSAATFRGTDKRGGANGARIRFAPQNSWEANTPAELKKVLAKLEEVRANFNKSLGGKSQISIADTIVLGGTAAVEKAARDAGFNVNIPFSAGRVDALQELTLAENFEPLKPTADGFRNYYKAQEAPRSTTEMLVDRASLLNLSAPEMTVLIGGLRVLDANTNGTKHGVFTDTPGKLTNAFFVNLLDMSYKWQESKEKGIYEGVDRKSGKVQYTATPVDLIFGSNSELRAVAEAYAAEDAKEKFVYDFIGVWTKVMNLDRFDH